MHSQDQDHAVITGEPIAPKGCTAGSGRGPLGKGPLGGNLTSGLPVLIHGCVAGRDFELRLVLREGALRIEVSDARGERWPEQEAPVDGGAESGYGLCLVAGLAAKWGVAERVVGKTVWAECVRPAGPAQG